MDVNKLMPLAIAGGLLWAAYKFAPNAAKEIPFVQQWV
jgi:hypothetical protein